MAGSSNGTFPTPSGVGNMEVEEDVFVIRECFVVLNRHSIKQEEIPENITFPDIKSEPDEVSYVCVCLLLETLIKMCFLCQYFWPVVPAALFGMKIFGCKFFFWGGGGCFRVWKDLY
jgi:hypothetical protein